MIDLVGEAKAREEALYVALRLVIGDDRWSSTDVIEFAEYIRAGEKPDLSGFVSHGDVLPDA